MGCSLNIMLRANIWDPLRKRWHIRSGKTVQNWTELLAWRLTLEFPDCAIWLRLARMRRRILLLCMFASLGRAGRAACLKHSSFGEAT
jgi:hypothetical protein